MFLFLKTDYFHLRFPRKLPTFLILNIFKSASKYHTLFRNNRRHKRCDMVSLNMIHILHVLLIKSVSKRECNFKYTSYRLLFIKSESKRDCNFKQSSITEWHVECTNLKTLSDQDERIRYSFLSTLDYFFSIVVSL